MDPGPSNLFCSKLIELEFNYFELNIANIGTGTEFKKVGILFFIVPVEVIFLFFFIFITIILEKKITILSKA